jgi:DNA-binding helix-hairpin-helix protein with protein kinase domain
LEARWKCEAGDQAFRAKRRGLDRAREEYLALPTRRQRQVHQLETDLHYRQLQHYLDRHQIGAARLPGIGPGREATLRSFGIETAADVTAEAISAIPGFGATLSVQLLGWRHMLVRQFVFDPKAPIAPSDVEALENDLRATKQRLEQTLQGGAAELRQIVQRVQLKRQTLRAEIEQALAALAQAEADLSVL